MEVNFLLGSIVTILSLIAWVGQCVVCIAPRQATQWRLNDCAADCDPAFYADAQGEAVWDALTLWTLPVAGILYLVQSVWWPYFGLAGGAIYFYFGGCGIATRVAMQRCGIRIGNQDMVSLSYGALGVWALTGGLTVAAAIAALQTGVTNLP